ncbi:hypothetical protein [Rhizobium phaseoli]|uniref:hypothetical protein n=1 Tax=Rhizobium phaseoli TaxID=396 RepID=UPI000BBB0D4B|nr:hypothetical protein [Rhizobium phaseoli]PCD66799.1 hypothetical protein CO648_15170 [Rhizobium phaseoli]
MTKARDFSQLATMLAEHASSPAEQPKPTIAKVRQPANDNKPARPLLAWPTFERLAHRGDVVRAFALRHWRDLCFPREMEIPDQEEQYEPECAIEIRPSEAELLGAVGRKVTGRARWDHTGEMANTYDDEPAPLIRYTTTRNGSLDASIGDLTFRNGELKQWGTTAKGRALRPDERRRGEKGGSKAERSESGILSYLELTGAISPFTAEPYLKPLSAEPAVGDYFTPSPSAQKARKLLQDLGIDGSVPFEQLPFQASRCPVGHASGALYLGGIKMPKPTASEPAGREPEFVRHVETADYVDRLRFKLGDHAKVLDLAISNTVAAEIGIAMGLAPAYAAKRGAGLIDEAIDRLIEIDETARGDFGSVPQKAAA